MKKLTAFVLSLITALSFCVPAMAADVGSDADVAETQVQELPDGCDEHPSLLSAILAIEWFFAMSDKVDFDKEFTAIYEQLLLLNEDEEAVQLSGDSLYALMCYVLSNREDRYSVSHADEEVASYWIYESPDDFALCLYMKQNGKMLLSICSNKPQFVYAELDPSAT